MHFCCPSLLCKAQQVCSSVLAAPQAREAPNTIFTVFMALSLKHQSCCRNLHVSFMHTPWQCRTASTTFRYHQILVQPQTLSKLLFLLTLQAKQGCHCKISLTTTNHHDFSPSLGNQFTVFVVQRRAVKYRMKYFLQCIIHFLDIMLKASTDSLQYKT